MIKIDISRDRESIADDITLTEEQAVVVLASILRVTASVAQILRPSDAPEEKENYPAFRKPKGRPKKPGPKATRSRWGSKYEAERASAIKKEIQESDADRRRKEGEAKRERIVLMLSEHFSVADIAKEVGVSEPTVYTLRKKMIEDGRLSAE